MNELKACNKMIKEAKPKDRLGWIEYTIVKNITQDKVYWVDKTYLNFRIKK